MASLEQKVIDSVFPEIDPLATAAQLNLAERGRNEGLNNRPADTEDSLSAAERHAAGVYVARIFRISQSQ